MNNITKQASRSQQALCRNMQAEIYWTLEEAERRE